MHCSVAMSTYNGERFLAGQLASVCRQTRPVDEIVISDDGSSDRTLEIIEEYKSANPQIRWQVMTASENQGFRKSFRRAIMHCKGELIFLCDQDDIWMENKVERTLKLFEANAQMLSLISDFRTIDAQGRFLRPEASTENLWVSDRVLQSASMPAKITLSEMLGRNQGQGCAMALRRSLAEEYVGLEQNWTHDWIINLLAAMHGGLYYCSEQLIAYRLHGKNVIGMAQGEHAQRQVPLSRRLYDWALALKYSFLEGDGEACRAGLMSVSMDKYDYVFERVACSGEEAAQRDAFVALQSRRLMLIEKKKLFSYLIFFLKNRRFFAENAYFATSEQVAIRVMMDLCAMLK